MKNILILGAGRSSPALVRYLSDQYQRYKWRITWADNASDRPDYGMTGLPGVEMIRFDVRQAEDLNSYVQKADLVISMVPARIHQQVAISCLRFKKNLITASYLSPEILHLKDEVLKSGLIFLTECGLDPGIDHMSAMAVIDRIREQGGKMRAFETFTGGMLSPDQHDENPWQYKFTWNPRNVILAGQGGVKFLQKGSYKYIPYHKIFRRIEMIQIPGYGYFEGYANRDSLKYRELYGLTGIKTLYRGTLRRPGFCHSWDVFVQLGATDDTYQMEDVDKMTHRSFINSFLSFNPFDSIELKLAHYMNLDMDSGEMYNLRWLGIFDEEPVGLKAGTPARILEHILMKKWTLSGSDTDLIVMWHKFEYLMNDQLNLINSYLITGGEDHVNTGMAKTVGWPAAIAASLILRGVIREKGILIPTRREIYKPVLEELKNLGVLIREEGPRVIRMPGRIP